MRPIRHLIPTLSVGLATMVLVARGALDHWIITQAAGLAMSRIDPIVSSNSVSGHVHNIMGASNFNSVLNSVDVQQQAKCTSTILVDDLSNYWDPYLYYRFSNNTYQPILSQSRIYYFTKGGNVTAFPQGLRMISGLAMSRNASATQSLGVMIACDGGQQTQYLPTYSTTPSCSVVNMAIYFPSCGLASGDLDSSDHFSHMAWPQSYVGSQLYDDPNGVYCPDSHPIKYPTIFLETNYQLSDQQTWRDDDNVLVLAHGDTTGLAYHADFVMGWRDGVLEDAIAACGSGTNGPNPADNPAACSAFAGRVNQTAAYACRLEGDIPDEDVGLYRPLDELPGCNPLWTADMPDTKPACNSSTSPSFVGPTVYFENLLFDMHIPMALEAASNTSLDFLSALNPSLGDAGASFVLPWGYSDGSDDGSVSVGTYEEIVAGVAGSGSASASVAPASASASASAAYSASAVSASASVGTVTNANLAAVQTSSSSAPAGAALSSSGDASGGISATATADAVSTSKSSSKKCRRRRSLVQRDTVAKGIKAHKARRGGHSHDLSSF